MGASRYVAAIVGAALAVSFALQGVASAQDEKWRDAYNAFRQRHYSQAETLFREVCVEYNDASEPWGWCHMMLGISLTQQGPSRRQEALEQLELAKSLVTDDLERFQLLIAIANVHLVDRRLPEALAAAEEADVFANAPTQRALVAKTRGQAHYGMEQWEQAASALEIAVEFRPSEANLHVWLGRSYFELGLTDQARTHLERGLELDPDNEVAKQFLARIRASLIRQPPASTSSSTGSGS